MRRPRADARTSRAGNSATVMVQLPDYELQIGSDEKDWLDNFSPSKRIKNPSQLDYAQSAPIVSARAHSLTIDRDFIR